MLNIKKEYVVGPNNKRKAVLIDMETFEKIEEILENYGLAKYMNEIEDEKELGIQEAKAYYENLEKG
jgi:hypothetical protein